MVFFKHFIDANNAVVYRPTVDGIMLRMECGYGSLSQSVFQVTPFLDIGCFFSNVFASQLIPRHSSNCSD